MTILKGWRDRYPNLAASETSKRKATGYALLLFAFLLVTNSYYSIKTDGEFITTSARDVWSYAAIAEAAPGLPPGKIPYHHAQRFALPAMAGLVGDWAGIPAEWAMRGLVALILLAGILLTDRFASRLGFGLALRSALIALIFFNPYSARIGLALPFLGNDLGFVLGQILILSGLYMGSASRMVAGSVLAILCRQTAILLVFPLGLVLLTARRHRLFRNSEYLTAAACAAIIVAGYFLTGRVAAAMSVQSRNLETISGLFIWLGRGFDLKLLALEFGARGLGALAVPVAAHFFIAPYVRRSGRTREHTQSSPNQRDALCAASFLLTAGLIALQPVLGGPAFGNLPRLSVLGLWPFAFGVAILIRGNVQGAEIRIPRAVLAGLLAALALHSLHHIFTWPGRLLLGGDPRWFFALQLVLCATLLTTGVAIRSRSAKQ